MILLEKDNNRVPEKYKLEIPAIIPLMTIIGVNHCQTILHMLKKVVNSFICSLTLNRFFEHM